MDVALQKLLDAEILFARGEPPAATYTFKHALIQETAYQSLLKRTRQQLHARVAQVLEERFPERVASEPEVVARHYDQAGLVAQAITHYQRAGERATQRSANEQGIKLYDPSKHGPLAYMVAIDCGINSHAFAGWCHFYFGHPDRVLAVSEAALAKV